MALPRKRDIENYAHTDKERVNNPPVGLVTPETDKDAARKIYAHDPHIDPQLSWAGKAEHAAFEVPTVSLHVHERIDPRTVIEAVRKRNGASAQASLFEGPEENPPIRQAIDFYQHRQLERRRRREPHPDAALLVAGRPLRRVLQGVRETAADGPCPLNRRVRTNMSYTPALPSSDAKKATDATAIRPVPIALPCAAVREFGRAESSSDVVRERESPGRCRSR